MVSDSGIPLLVEPLLPVIVTMTVLVLALRLAVIFRVEFALEFAPPALAETGLGLKLALTPFGNPLTLRLTEFEPLVAVS
jgi:hypothetical protein